MISENRLRTLARERKKGVGLTEKDYVNSWILYAIFTSPLGKKLVFKGGTALSKLYFPVKWRFSEDLDFTVVENGLEETQRFRKALDRTEEISGIDFIIKSTHSNPDYMQIRIQYDAILQQKNTTNLDFFRQEHIYFPVKELSHSLEDIPEFKIRVYSLKEILVEKLRSLFQRARARDYYDLYQLIQTRCFDKREILEALLKKSEYGEVDLNLSQFPEESDIESVRGYWDRALDRLTTTKPEFDLVVRTIGEYIEDLKKLSQEGG